MWTEYPDRLGAPQLLHRRAVGAAAVVAGGPRRGGRTGSGTLYKARQQGRPLRARTATRLEAAGLVRRLGAAVLSAELPRPNWWRPGKARMTDVAAELAGTVVSAADRELHQRSAFGGGQRSDRPQADPTIPGEVADAHAS